MQEERHLVGVVGIGQLQGLGIEVFIGHAPGVLEADVAFLDAALVHYPVAVAAEEGIHVVEVAAPAIHEHAVVAHLGQLLAQAGKAAFTADALDDRAPWCGRHGQGNGLQAPIGTRAGGVEVVEVQALLA